jgi:protein FAM32A
MSKPVVIGGKFKFKSGGSTSVDKVKKRKLDAAPVDEIQVNEKITEPEVVRSTLTETQKKQREKQAKLETKIMKDTLAVSYRDRIDAFNNKLASLTEHNDIPRISAAGNG